MYTCKDNLTPLLYSGKIKLKKKKEVVLRSNSPENPQNLISQVGSVAGNLTLSRALR